jgi:hypothetical protein
MMYKQCTLNKFHARGEILIELEQHCYNEKICMC